MEGERGDRGGLIRARREVSPAAKVVSGKVEGVRSGKGVGLEWIKWVGQIDWWA